MLSPKRAILAPCQSGLAAAAIVGVDAVYVGGGAQAIGALAYGTQSIARVDKICGPGSLFTTLAKRQVFGTVGIDGLPGPTETVVIADEHADPQLAAADLLAQAFGLAVDRVVALQRSEERRANLEAAIDSHRLIGQAAGILVERHRLTPGEAFDRLKQASQNRNLQLREVASRVVETGTEPENA